MIFLIGLSIVLIDQIIKMLVTTNISYGTSIGNLVRITNVSNTGMAYSIGQNSTIIIAILNIVIIYLLLRFMIKNYNNISNIVKISLMMVISGGTSNLIDRIIRGYVVDYIDINQIFSYPIFNIADISVVLGVVLIIGNLLIKTIKNQEKA